MVDGNCEEETANLAVVQKQPVKLISYNVFVGSVLFVWIEIEGLAPTQYGIRRLHCVEIEVFTIFVQKLPKGP